MIPFSKLGHYVYHEYKDVWKLEIREVMKMQHEMKNKQDKNAVAVVRDREDVCHILWALASTKQATKTI